MYLETKTPGQTSKAGGLLIPGAKTVIIEGELIGKVSLKVKNPRTGNVSVFNNCVWKEPGAYPVDVPGGCDIVLVIDLVASYEGKGVSVDLIGE